MTTIEKFERWVKSNYKGRRTEAPPADWDRDVEFFYKIDGIQYRIRYSDVPLEFKQGRKRK